MHMQVRKLIVYQVLKLLEQAERRLVAQSESHDCYAFYDFGRGSRLDRHQCQKGIVQAANSKLKHETKPFWA